MDKKGVARLFSALMLVVALAFFTGWKKEGSIKEITRPYLGVYRLERFVFGGEEQTDRFRSVELELNKDGTFLLIAEGKTGEKYRGKGRYEYDGNEGKFTVFKPFGSRTEKADFSLSGGTLRIVAVYGDKTMLLIFSR